VALPGFYPDSMALGDVHADNIVLGQDGGVQVHVAPDKIELGQANSLDKAALDSKIQIELTRIATELAALTVAYNLHIHVTTATIGASGTPGVISPTVAQAPIPGAPSPTASTLVTIKE
jgi:hypothetical protein